jgi:hypothetical protein
MPIAFDVSNKAGNNDGTSTLTFAHTCSGTNRILFVDVACNDSTNTCTGVTYNGVSMTQVPGSSILVVSTRHYLFYLINPAAGANNVVATMSNSTLWKTAVSASYTGVSQTGFPDASGTGSQASSPSFTESLTTVADNSWLVWAFGNAQGTAGSNTTVRNQDALQFGNGFADTNGAQTPPGSKSMNVTGSSSTWGGIMISIAPFLIPLPSVQNQTFVPTRGGPQQPQNPFLSQNLQSPSFTINTVGANVSINNQSATY